MKTFIITYKCVNGYWWTVHINADTMQNAIIKEILRNSPRKIEIFSCIYQPTNF